MWQRIQTLYLAVATALVASLFFCNFVTIIGPEGDTVSIRYSEKIPYLCLMISLISANIIALASFKRRLVQMRVSVMAALLLIGFQAWILIDFIPYRHEMVLSFTAAFPAVAAILDFLAARNAFIDEVLVRSSSSLRDRRK